ncbi:SpvB/TcaC N-terminal domain-containing protein [Streptomyces sp. NPDC052012]|uniref:SpvB/TcaC N-terminal domain-containing protein n=1 Tax=Streptomyces sp. NPDC052012 TaxID=3155051 RepID=UPI00344B782A
MEPTAAPRDPAPDEGDRRPATAPSVSLPKGGGALRGIGETFGVAPATGTAGLQIPVPAPQGRSGFGPSLTLSYDSGAGNGPFGLGWSLGLPTVTRKTDKGLPRYLDSEESDTFLLSGSEDLVPVLEEGADGQWHRQTLPAQVEDGRTYEVRRYRPRVEGTFARIERWTDEDDATTHWRSISGDNVITLYGADDESRVHDPSAPPGAPRVFAWLISESRDDKGNVIRYRYAREDDTGIDALAAHERHRTSETRGTQRFLKRVLYGNRTSGPAGTPPGPDPWMFEVVLDYGDHDPDEPTPAGAAWTCRRDPFSTHRPGFEVRTYRLCRRFLVFHHFPDEPSAGRACLVRSLDLAYDENPVASLLVSATPRGYRRTGGGLTSRSLPPLELDYSAASLGESSEVRTLDGPVAGLAVGAEGSAAHWVDLDGEGIPGVLTTTAEGWRYAANRGGGEIGAPRLQATVPTVAQPDEGGQLLDLAGDGRLDLVAFAASTPGFLKRTDRHGWAPFRVFEHLPNVSWSDGSLRFTDLVGDGRADLLISEGDALTWYPSMGESGFGPARRVPAGSRDGQGPAPVAADTEHAVFLADMSGDGLPDLVRVRHDEVCYWPNLGYGRFGAAVRMDDPPLLDTPDLFDPRRVLLADLDGAGPHDLLYLGASGLRVYVNQSGNRWDSAVPVVLPDFPTREHPTTVDLLGTGTPCLVWASSLPTEARTSVRYLELMPRGKPHLLTGIRNNLGAETVIGYSTSTAFRLADEAAGRPWVTRLPFPVHVVDRVDTVDHVSCNRFTTRYAYHHGYFDSAEREFRGFARVDQWDTAQFAALTDSTDPPASLPDPVNLAAASHSPPVRVTTWYHTGAFTDAGDISLALADEYYREGAFDGPDLLRPDQPPPPRHRAADGTTTPWRLSPDEAREVQRAMRGAVLRQEVYAEDGTDAAPRPYSVEEHSYGIEVVQPSGPNSDAVFMRHTRETVTLHYERTVHQLDGSTVADPRIMHELVLAVDPFGNTLRSASIAYGRRHRDADPRLTDADHAAQRLGHVQITENAYTAPIDTAGTWRTPLLCEARTYQLHGFDLPAPDSAAPLVEPDTLARAVAALADGHADLPYTDVDGEGAAAGPHRRLVEHHRTLFRRDDLSGPEPLGRTGALALPHEHYRLALTPDVLAAVYRRDGDPLLSDPAAVLTAAGYRDTAALGGPGGFPATDPPGLWWEPSGTISYATIEDEDELAEARRHFFVPRRFRDPFGSVTTVAYDPDDLLVRETVDALGNRTTVGERRPDGVVWRNDYRVLAPALVTDTNGNRDAVAFDVLGVVVGTATMGKIDSAGDDEQEGDTLDGFEPDLPDDVTERHLRHPADAPLDILGQATTRLVYDVDAYRRAALEHGADPPATGPPVAVLTLARERHSRGPDAVPLPRVQASLTYSDGFGREIMRKHQAAPGADGTPRWVSSGWTVFDNKGRPVRQFEPFFSDTPEFETDFAHGVSPVICRDPLGRVVATLHPDHTWQKIAFTPWGQTTWDAGDTSMVDDPSADPHVGPHFARLPAHTYLPTWRAARLAEPPGPAHEAARQAEVYADTPTTAFFDALGRPFLTIAVNRALLEGTSTTEQHPLRVDRDIEGNERAVHDQLGRQACVYAYDLLGHRVHERHVDSGDRWTLLGVDELPLRAWNSRHDDTRTEYDLLRRPVGTFLRRAGQAAEIRIGRSTYGDDPGHPGGAAAAAEGNLRGRLFESFDGSGLTTTLRYDLGGRPEHSEFRTAAAYRDPPDWSLPPQLDGPALSTSTRHDALGRPLSRVLPDGSRLTFEYDDGGLLRSVTGGVRGAEATAFVTDIGYDAKGRRTHIALGNGVRTAHTYDPLTFRLATSRTTRGTGFPDDCPQPGAVPCGIPNLTYTYDPVGNITHIRDDAQQTVFFRNQRIAPSRAFVYDAVYRLVEGTGREHLGQTGGQLDAPVPTDWKDASRTGVIHPGDGSALGAYRQRFHYDPVGNLSSVRHSVPEAAGQSGWTRDYLYEPGTNRLASTTTGATVEEFTHDAHGNMTRMPHLSVARWNHHDQLAAVATQFTNQGTPETTYYVYDATGRRTRKVTEGFAAEGATPVRTKERIYLEDTEIYREYGPDGTTVTLERETLHIMDDTQRVALVETRTIGTDRAPAQLVRYQLADHLDSSAVELDERARVISYEEYHPYGTTAYQAVGAGIEAPKRYRFAGRERDEESGLTYCGARHYASWLGRWTSCDPAGLTDGLGPYTYGRGDPVGHTDPDGMASKKIRHKINDVVQYGKKLVDRHLIGKNVQKDHVISQGKMRLMRTDPKGRVHYDPKKDPTVVVETGKATPKSAAKPHTKKTFHHPQSDVNELNRLKKEGMTHFTTDIVDPSRKAAVESGMAKKAVDEAVRGQLDELHSSQSLKETAKEVRELDAAAKKEQAAKKALLAGKEAGVVEGKELLSTGTKGLLKAGGKKVLKYTPVVGIAVGIVLVANDAKAGDLKSAAWDAAEAVPVVGDVVGAGHMGMETGEAANNLLGIDQVAAEHGESVRQGVKKLTGWDGTALVAGGVVAGVSAITVAPGLALGRTLGGWIKK